MNSVLLFSKFLLLLLSSDSVISSTDLVSDLYSDYPVAFRDASNNNKDSDMNHAKFLKLTTTPYKKFFRPGYSSKKNESYTTYVIFNLSK